MSKEELYVNTAKLEHIEMYLKTIWRITEKGEQPQVSTISKMLTISQPSVVWMLHKLDKENLINYKPGSKIIQMTVEGKNVAMRIIRNSRLLEVLMKDTLKIPIDNESTCGIEHHMNNNFAEALCKLLDHPSVCPHGNNIPLGKCCQN